MKILCPELDVTIIDSLNKRINFLNLLADELELSGVHFYHGRAEDFWTRQGLPVLSLILLQLVLLPVCRSCPS